MIYIASPYSSKHKCPNAQAIERENRYHSALDYNAQLLNDGHYAYSPIVHCHEMANKHGLRKDFEYWQGFNRHMIELASALHVLALDGWEESEGVQGEIEYAKSLSVPVVIVHQNRGATI